MSNQNKKKLHKIIIRWLFPFFYEDIFIKNIASITTIIIFQMLVSQIIFKNLMFINFFTIWLIVISQHNPKLWKKLILTIWGALLIETYSAVPNWLYVCSYSIVVGIITVIQNIIVWNKYAWSILFIISELIIILFENLVIGIISKTFHISIGYIIYIVFRLCFTYCTGMFIIIYWMQNLNNHNTVLNEKNI